MDVSKDFYSILLVNKCKFVLNSYFLTQFLSLNSKLKYSDVFKLYEKIQIDTSKIDGV